MERIQAAIQKAKEQRAGGMGDAPAVPRRTTPATGAAPVRQRTDQLPPAWETLKPFTPDPEQMRRERIVAFERSDPIHLTFDMLRTKILRQMREKGWKSLAIASPTSGCGKTMVSLNLALSFAQQKDSRTVLMDMDLRRPALAKVLGVREEGHSMEAFLQGTGSLQENFIRYGHELAIGTNVTAAGNPAELLYHPAAGRSLAQMKAELRPDIILYDMPPMLTCDDVMAFLPNVDCVLLVAGAEVSTIDEIDRCERDLAEQGNVLGVILNKCRYVPEEYGYSA